MIIRYFIFRFAFLSGFLCFGSSLVQAQQDKNINWPTFMAKHNLIWEDLPLQWNEGAFTGNGLLGMMVYISQADSAVVFNIGRSDVTDHRLAPDKKTSFGVATATVSYDFCRLPIGKLLLKTGGKIVSGSIVQDIWNAEIRGTIQTTVGELAFRAFTPRDADVQIIEVSPSPSYKNSRYDWKFIPGRAYSPRALVRKERGGEGYIGNPAAELYRENGFSICKQTLTAGGDYATVWKQVKKDNAETLYISTANEVPKANVSVAKAMGIISATEKRKAADIATAHRNWWHAFYKKSFLSIPDARVESFYWIQLYKMATASRPGGPAVDLFGPYYKTSAWAGMWWNLNIQLTYYPVYASNHLELGENMIDIVDEYFPTLLRRLGGKKLGDLSWTMHNYYKQFSYNDDEESIKTKWLPKAIAVYTAYTGLMQAEKNNKIGLGPMESPEYKDDTPFINSTYNLSNLKWLLQTIIKTGLKSGLYQNRMAGWKDTLSRIIDYPVNENGLMISSNQAMEMSHRHYSHLVSIYPLSIIDPDLPESKKLVEKSVTHWHQLEGGKGLAGYSFTGAASLYAALGKGDAAIKNIHQLLNGKTGISQFHANTFYTESGGTNEVIETPLSGAAAIMELLLQSRDEKIIVFPALPTDWKEAAFSNLLAERGFLISAQYENGRTQWITVKSKTGKPFILKCPGLNQLTSITANGKFKQRIIPGTGEIEVSLQAGATLVLKQNKNTVVQVQPSAHDASGENSFGIKKGGQLKSLQDYKVKDFEDVAF